MRMEGSSNVAISMNDIKANTSAEEVWISHSECDWDVDWPPLCVCVCSRASTLYINVK